MVSLRDVVNKDLDLFFNTDEMADNVTINEKPYVVIIKSNALKELQLKMGDGVNRAELLFSIKKLDLPGKPKVKSRMKFNGATYDIMSCIDEGNTYQIMLGANQ